MQIQTRAIEDSAVTGAKLRLLNLEEFRARNAAGTSDINLFKVNEANDWVLLVTPKIGYSQVATEEFVTESLDDKVNVSAIGASEGVCPLDLAGKVPAAFLPSYVDDILEYDVKDTPAPAEPAVKIIQALRYEALTAGAAGNNITITYEAGGTAGSEVVTIVGTDITVTIEDGVSTGTQIKSALEADPTFSALALIFVYSSPSVAQTVEATASLEGGIDEETYFPVTGEAGKIYVEKVNNLVYRWSGSAYTPINTIVESSDDVAEGSTNLYFTELRAQVAAVVNSTAGSETNKAPSVNAIKTYVAGLNSDTFTEGTTNKYFTDARAKTSAVVNSTAGTETDQAPSVSSVKTYVTGLTSDTFLEGSTNKYFTDSRAKTAAVVNTTSGSETTQAPSVSSIKTYVSSAITPASVSISALDVDWSLGFLFYKDLAANSTLTFSNVTDGKTISVVIRNTSGSDITITLPTTIKTAAFVATVKASNKETVFTFMRLNGKTYATSLGDMS